MYPINKALVVSLLLLAGCSSPSPVESLRWLEGSWKQATIKNKRSSAEKWEYDAGELKGMGVSLYGDAGTYDTLLIERFRIIVREKELFYESSLPLKAAVVYRLTDSGENFWTFSNPQQEFPKHITYRKTTEGFTSTVSNDNRTVELNYIRND